MLRSIAGIAGFALTLSLAAAPVAAQAQDITDLPLRVSVDAGFMNNQGGAFTGIATLDSPSVSTVGIHPQVSFGYEFNGGGRYQFTLEGTHRVAASGRTFFGAGVGVGQIASGGSTGGIFDLIGGYTFAPHTAAIARYYSGFSNGPGSGLMLGVRFRP